MQALELSDAANGIPGAIDSNDKKTYNRAKKRLQFTEEAGPSIAAVNTDESIKEDDEMSQQLAELPAAVSSIPSRAMVADGSAQSAKP
jgi:hypothetical protein